VLSHPSHVQFEQAHSCNGYYDHLTEEAKDVLMQYVLKYVQSASQETALL